MPKLRPFSPLAPANRLLMHRYPFVFLVLAFAFAACDSGNDAPLVSGITPTNPGGGLTGQPDLDDWRPTADGALQVDPAYPNPASGPANLRFIVDRAQRVMITVVDHELDPVGVAFDETVEADLLYAVAIERPGTGLFRIIIETEKGSSYGDVEFR